MARWDSVLLCGICSGDAWLRIETASMEMDTKVRVLMNDEAPDAEVTASCPKHAPSSL